MWGEQVGAQKAAGALCFWAGLHGGSASGHDRHCYYLEVSGMGHPRPRGWCWAGCSHGGGQPAPWLLEGHFPFLLCLSHSVFDSGTVQVGQPFFLS